MPLPLAPHPSRQSTTSSSGLATAPTYTLSDWFLRQQASTMLPPRLMVATLQLSLSFTPRVFAGVGVEPTLWVLLGTPVPVDVD